MTSDPARAPRRASDGPRMQLPGDPPRTFGILGEDNTVEAGWRMFAIAMKMLSAWSVTPATVCVISPRQVRDGLLKGWDGVYPGYFIVVSHLFCPEERGAHLLVSDKELPDTDE